MSTVAYNMIPYPCLQLDVPGPPTYQEIISKPVHFEEAFKAFNVGATRFPPINQVILFTDTVGPVLRGTAFSSPQIFPLKHCNFPLCKAVTSMKWTWSHLTEPQKPVCVVFHLY